MTAPQLNSSIMGSVDLGPDIDGYQLRARRLVLEPGSAIPMHHHKNRPALTYVLEGTLTVSTPSGDQHVHQAGDVVRESRDVVHSAQNLGMSKVVLVSVDIVKNRSGAALSTSAAQLAHAD